MRLRSKLIVVLLPVVIAGLALQWVVSSYEQSRQWTGARAALLAHLLDNAVLRLIDERHRVLATYSLEQITVYVERYQAAALSDLADLAERADTLVVVLDRDGRTLLPAGLTIDEPLRERALLEQQGAFAGRLAGETHLFVARTAEVWGWTVLAGYPLQSEHVAIRRVNLAVTATLLLTGLMMVLCLFVGLDRLVIRPIRLLEQSARALARRRRPQDLPLDGGDEVAELAFAMDAMATAIATHTTELERSNTELDQFAAAVSHDLRAPLRAMVNLASWIEADSGPLPAVAIEHLDRLRDAAGRMDAMLQDLLRYARASHLVGRVEPCDVRALIDAQLELLAPEKPVALTVEIKVDALVTPEAPLALVLRNLIDNAIKHHDRERVALHIVVERRARHAEFRVTDDGPGIPPAEHDRIFDIFRVRDGRSSGGSGIGLALVRRIVQRLGGTMRLESDGRSRGTTFVFDWPLDCTLLTGEPARLPPAQGRRPTALVAAA